jgi:hypothetical protein
MKSPKIPRACIQIHGLNSQAILLRLRARISEKYATILKKFCDRSWAKESQSEANEASARLNLNTGSRP